MIKPNRFALGRETLQNRVWRSGGVETELCSLLQENFLAPRHPFTMDAWLMGNPTPVYMDMGSSPSSCAGLGSTKTMISILRVPELRLSWHVFTRPCSIGMQQEKNQRPEDLYCELGRTSASNFSVKQNCDS